MGKSLMVRWCCKEEDGEEDDDEVGQIECPRLYCAPKARAKFCV